MCFICGGPFWILEVYKGKIQLGALSVHRQLPSLTAACGRKGYGDRVVYNIRTLSNGIRVVSEKFDHIKSVSLGVCVGNGSRYEPFELNGISHYIEHILFKGTKNRSAYQIAWEMDSVGGMINAFTSREQTCFYTQTLNSHIGLAIDLLSDMLVNSVMSDEFINLERQVITEEINMYDDDPSEVVQDLIAETVWGASPLGKPVLGKTDTLANINSDVMRKYMYEHYVTGNIVISVAGSFEDSMFDLLEEKFGKADFKKGTQNVPFAEYKASSAVLTRDVGQVQLVVGFNGIDTKDERMYSMLAMNNIFGSGMSSRLFQNIREKTGLVYSIYSAVNSYIGTGMFSITAGTGAENVSRVCELICDEVKKLKRDKLSKAEVDMVKEQLKGNYILGSESTGSRMLTAGRNLVLGKELLTQEQVLAKIDKITTDSVADVIDVIDTSELSVAAVGAIDSVDGLFKF